MWPTLPITYIYCQYLSWTGLRHYLGNPHIGADQHHLCDGNNEEKPQPPPPDVEIFRAVMIHKYFF